MQDRTFISRRYSISEFCSVRQFTFQMESCENVKFAVFFHIYFETILTFINKRPLTMIDQYFSVIP